MHTPQDTVAIVKVFSKIKGSGAINKNNFHQLFLMPQTASPKHYFECSMDPGAEHKLWTVVTWKWLRSFTDAHPAKRFKALSIQGSGKLLLQNVYLLPAADFKIFQTATVTQASRTSKAGATCLVNRPMSYSVWCDQCAREGLLWGAGPPFTYRVDACIGVGERGRYSFSPNWSCLLHYQLISRGARSALLTEKPSRQK